MSRDDVAWALLLGIVAIGVIVDAVLLLCVTRPFWGAP